MSNLYYAYKNKLWKVIHNFQYTGKAEPFTLDPGKYLLICHGAKGGVASVNVTNYGGSSYGVLNLQNKTQMYAVVGGDGEPPSDNSTPGKGGFNGGGDGGHSYNNAYTPGAGGGGATDIRLQSPDAPEQTVVVKRSIPDEYREVTYIQSTGTQYIDTGIIPTSNSKAEVKYAVNAIGNTACGIFGSADSDITTRFQIYQNSNINNGIGGGYVRMTEDTDIHVSVLDAKNLKVYYDGVEQSATTGTFSNNPMPNNTITLFARHTGDSSFNCGKCKIYYVKIWENDELIGYYIPAQRISDNVCGMYNLVNNTFLVNNGSDSFTSGETVEEKTVYTTNVVVSSLHSRLIVAGGGGGGTNIAATVGYANYTGNGGGIVGGFPCGSLSDTCADKYPTQVNGYSFGNGMSAPDKTASNTEGSAGASGGGGGWYGGYTFNSGNLQRSSTGGGGGSGYVLTASSYKPEGYLLGEEYYLTDTTLTGGLSNKSEILICVEVSYPASPGDIIIFPCVGESSCINLLKGKYKLKCWGGSGGCRHEINESQRGGYSEGILTVDSEAQLYGVVGGSGIGTELINVTYSNMNYPYAMYNGGGVQASSTIIFGNAGGGATDFRIGSDSLYARVIVAGGAGGNGGPNRFGGVGGGESGGTNTVTSGSGYGDSPGPGTHSSTPKSSDSSHATINGGFGYGGNGVYYSNGYGGAGGGGWYGGSGTYPDGSGDDDRGGNGGSGYILTATTYKPEGYLLGEEYYLTDGKTIAGGNDLPIGQTRAEIEVIECATYKLLCYDEEGYKRYDEPSNSWVLLSNQNKPTPETFEEYGVYTFPTDTGLMNEYDILVHDPEEKLLGVSLDVVPPEQHISRTIMNKMNIAKLIIDADFDPDVYSVRYNVDRKGVGSDTRITLHMYVKKKVKSNKKFKMYCISAYSK